MLLLQRQLIPKILMQIDKKSYKNADFTTLDTLRLKKNDDYECIYIVNPLHFRISHASGYTEEKMEINT